MSEFLLHPLTINNNGVFKMDIESNSWNYIDDGISFPSIDIGYWHYSGKSAREKVQDEILGKIADALEANDLKKARELAKLAKAIKEL